MPVSSSGRPEVILCGLCDVKIQSLLLLLLWGVYWPVPAGSSSCVGNVTVYVWHKPTELAHSFLSCSCVLFLSLWPFQLYFIPRILPTPLRFLALFFWSYICLIGPFNCISLYESPLSALISSPVVDLAQNTNKLTNSCLVLYRSLDERVSRSY